MVLARAVLLRADKYVFALQGAQHVAVAVFSLLIWSLGKECGAAFGLPGLGIVALQVVFLHLALGTYLVLRRLLRVWALADSEKSLCTLSPFILVSARFMTLVGLPFLWLSHYVLARSGLAVASERRHAASAEDLSEMVEISTKAGEIEDDAHKMLKGVFTFSDTVVREVMTPRKDIVAVSETTSVDELLKVFKKEGVSRLVVFGRDLDDVKGVLIAKDLISIIVQKTQEQYNAAKLMRTVLFVPSSKKVDELLEEFRHQAMHFAVVLDELGSVDGVVTLEDLLEEIVGEIFDEYDQPLDELPIRKTKNGDLLVAGHFPIDDLNEQCFIGLPRGEYDSLAGLILHQLGHFPQAGEVVESRGVTLKVEAVSQQRVTWVRIVGGAQVSESNAPATESEKSAEKRLLATKVA